MMRLRRGRHLRSRPGRLLVVLVAAIVLGTASSAAALHISRNRDLIDVTILADGATRPVRVARSATVATALDAAALVPRSGRLLSVVTHSVLPEPGTPAQFDVNGHSASRSSPVAAGATVRVIVPPDTVEGTTEDGAAVAAPPEPDVITRLWHPGRPGKEEGSVRGAVSGELVSRSQAQPVLPPTPVTEKLVALTFDDGPWPTTPQVLQILKEKNVKAMFCVVTRQVVGKRLAYVKDALADGHELCNHTVDHDEKLPTRPQQVIADEVIGANRQLQERLGLKPAYYRPPGGALGPAVIATAKAEGQQVLVWTIDTKDYTKPPPAAIVGAVMGQVQPGAIVLMHDGGGDRRNTIAALPVIIDQLRAAGYELVLPDAISPVGATPATPTSPPA